MGKAAKRDKVRSMAKRPCLLPIIRDLHAQGDSALALDLLRYGGYTRRAALCELARMTTTPSYSGDRSP